jgi:hypothetical protein
MTRSSGDRRPDGAIAYDTTRSDSMRELAYREGDGLEVRLLWDERRDRLAVSVFDWKTGDCFALEAARDRALDVFDHPFSYAVSRTAPPATDELLAA